MANVKSRILSKSRTHLVDPGLLAVALSWGASYSLMQIIICSGVSIPLFLMLRFTLAAPCLCLWTRLHWRNFSREEVVSGVIFGILLYAILTCETSGVSKTSAANAGFLIALSVVLVPFFELIINKRKQCLALYLTCIVSLFGGALLSHSVSGEWAFNRGDMLILLAAFIRGFQITLFGKLTAGKSGSLVNITFIELLTVALLGLTFVITFQRGSLLDLAQIRLSVWLYILLLSILATAFAFLMQLYAAKMTSPTRVGLILSLEPAFAAGFAVVLMGEILSAWQAAGGVIIVMAAIAGRLIEGRR